MNLAGKRVLVTGGTGSLGKAIVRRVLSGERGRPAKLVVFSRDEAKQHYMRLSYLHRRAATDEVIYENFKDLLSFRIGDVRDYPALAQAVRGADVVIHAAALKQVPTCEYFPAEAVETNVRGAMNLARAIRQEQHAVTTVVAISTDKACKPINVMGMTKALQERVILEANIGQTDTRVLAVRYGNVISSRGSVVPLFRDQIANGGPVTITSPEMTRFLLTLDRAVDTVFEAIDTGKRGETYVPRIGSAKVVDIAAALVGNTGVDVVTTGVRPGEKLHEIMVSEEEVFRTVERGEYYAIRPILPELHEGESIEPALREEYSSRVVTLDQDALRELIASADDADDGSA